ncbi:MAG: amidohydrolase family protein [Acidimicrobiales bacterium]
MGGLRRSRRRCACTRRPTASAARRDERLARFDGDLWLGFVYEETLAVASLVLGGVLDRHPTLDVCVSHGAAPRPGWRSGWSTPRTRPWGAEALAEPGAVTERLRRWWDAHVGGLRRWRR